jgi:class 3 adenylate cyclase
MSENDYRLAAIVSVDSGTYTSLRDTGEDSADWEATYLSQLVAATSARHGGRVVASEGCSFLLEFPNTLSAVRYGLALHEAVDAHNDEHVAHTLNLRVGVHLGDIAFTPHGAHGDGVDTAARLKSSVAGAGMCVSQDVHNQVARRLEARFRESGDVSVPETGSSVRAFRVVKHSAAHSAARTADDDAGSTSERETEGEPPDWDAIMDMVVARIKRAGRRIDVERLRRELPIQGPEFDRFLDKLVERGFLSRFPHDPAPSPTERGYPREGHRHGRKSRRRDPARRDDSPSMDFARYQVYREQVTEGAAKAWTGFWPHLTSFAMVNGALFVLWLSTGAGHPWFYYPLGGWGIGLISHWATIKAKERERRDVERYEALNAEETKALKKLHKAKGGLISNLAATLSVTGFLFGINMITSPGFPWFLFPAAGMGIGLVSSLANYSNQRRRARKVLQDAKSRPAPAFVQAEAHANEPELIREAERLRASIREQISRLDSAHEHVGRDIPELLDRYVQQIRELYRRTEELDRIVAEVPMQELREDRERLRSRIGGTEQQKLRNEYERSIAEIDRQERSWGELRDQREILDLRSRSAINSLKQIQLDLARMKAVPGLEESTAALRERSAELSRYLEDLREGYSELGESS